MNTETAAPGPEDEAPLDELTERFVAVVRRLSGFGDITDEIADGILTAVALHPRRPEIDAWLPALVEGDAFDRCFADPADADSARATLTAYLERIVEALDPEALLESPTHVGLQPFMREWTAEDRARALADDDDPEVARWLHTGAAWANGLLSGLEALVDHAPPLPSGDALPEFLDCLSAVTALTWGDSGEQWHEHVRRHWHGRAPSRDQLIDAAIVAAEEIRLIWLDAALKPAPRIVGEKIGRNDPCPCGSGRKYKRCHGTG
jgi:uncharacterized protein